MRTIRRLISRVTMLGAAAALPTVVAAQNKPTLVVQLTVDQLRSDYIDKFRPQFTGGFKRLLDQGAFFTQAFHDHAVTETAPGHATLWSGRFPSHTGVVLNEIGAADPQAPLLFGRGGGASPYRFRGTAFFDWVRTRDQFSRALSVSRKDRGAILPLGRAKQQVYWYSLDGAFTTSRYYADTLPTWVQRFNARDVTAKYLGTEWNLLLPASEYTEKDSVPVERGGRDFTFPHKLSADRRQGTFQFTEFPWMDEITVDMALEGVQALDLGKGPSTDVLNVSLSTLDAVGHAYGPNSLELHDQLLRTDRALGRLIDSLYKLRDSSTIVFALGSDHGVSPYPELVFPGTDPLRGRVDIRPILDAARSGLAAKGVEGDALLFQSGLIILDRPRLVARKVNADSVVNALRTALLKVPGMARVDRVSTLGAAAAKGDKIARRWYQSVPPDLQGELALTLKESYYWITWRIAMHGTPYDRDAHIPIMFMGPMIKPGRYTQPIRSVDVAPTLAEIVGVPPTEPIDGKPLRMILPASGGR